MTAAAKEDPSVTVSPLDDFEGFVKNIGVHQATAALISNDYGCSMADAAHDAWLSEPYGEIEFPVDELDPVLINLRSKVNLSRARGTKKRNAAKPKKDTMRMGEGVTLPTRTTRSTRPDANRKKTV